MICSICGLDKPENDFYKSNRKTCKECSKERIYNQRIERLKKYAEENNISYNPLGHRKKSDDPSLKWCSGCNQFLPLSEFGVHYRNSNRYINTYCKKCSSQKVIDSPNREVVMLNSNINRKIRKSKDKEYNDYLKTLDAKYRDSERGILKTLLNNAKKRASLYNIDYNITIEDISLPKICPILKIPIQKGKVGGGKYSPSLDRIDPNKGYVKGNVQVISRLANIMKSNASPEELRAFANWVNTNY